MTERAVDATSRSHAEAARRLFVATRNTQLKAVAGEQRTKSQALASLARSYQQLRATFLRVVGTTYQGWIDHGPHATWEELVTASHDDAVWDRLVERCVAELEQSRSPRRAREP